jgi:hypothetical protein
VAPSPVVACLLIALGAAGAACVLPELPVTLSDDSGLDASMEAMEASLKPDVVIAVDAVGDRIDAATNDDVEEPVDASMTPDTGDAPIMESDATDGAQITESDATDGGIDETNFGPDVSDAAVDVPGDSARDACVPFCGSSSSLSCNVSDRCGGTCACPGSLTCSLNLCLRL